MVELEDLKIQEEIDGIGTVIFEWDRCYNVIAYDEHEELFRKEFMLGEATYQELFDLIDYYANNPNSLTRGQ